MNDNTNISSNTFMDIAAKKLETQDKRLALLEQKLDTPPNNEENIIEIKSAITKIREDVKSIACQLKDLPILATRLSTFNTLLNNLSKNGILHHYHIPKLAWVTAGLFLVFSLTCTAWLMTYSKLQQYEASDTKYRYIRLISHTSVLTMLHQIDSLYNSDHAMRDSVNLWEEEQKRKIELHQRLKQKNIEDFKLKQELKSLESKSKIRETSNENY